VAPTDAPDLAAFRDHAATAGILLDFDGTLAEIVARPELAAPVDGARSLLEALVAGYALVGILTGRRAAEVEHHLAAVAGLRFFGLYGLEGVETPALDRATIEAARTAATVVPEAWVEDKGGSLAVHYRQAADPPAARASLVPALEQVAGAAHLEVIEGKMVVELVPPGRPLKGGALERLRQEHGLEAILYAGDDLADVDAFESLDRLRASGTIAIKVAVRGAETPTELIAAADLVADRPSGLVELLRTLV
jgi:trehalose 6-phosphate phosphatase